MKKIFSIVVFSLLTLSAFSQDNKVIFADTDKANEAKSLGVYHFEFDNSFTVEQIEKVRAYYVEYFKVTTMTTEKGIYVTLKLIDDSETAKRVMQRFFSSLYVQKIDVMGTDVEVMVFIQKFVL